MNFFKFYLGIEPNPKMLWSSRHLNLWHAWHVSSLSCGSGMFKGKYCTIFSFLALCEPNYVLLCNRSLILGISTYLCPMAFVISNVSKELFQRLVSAQCSKKILKSAIKRIFSQFLRLNLRSRPSGHQRVWDMPNKSVIINFCTFFPFSNPLC